MAGLFLAESAVVLADRAGISEGLDGSFLTALVTSMPELVTTLAAVRAGALVLAMGGILGGNTFDVLFVAFADIAYRSGSVNHAVTDGQAYLAVLAILMTAVLLLGLMRRQRHGVANIGFESVSLLGLYLGGMGLYAVAIAN